MVHIVILGAIVLLPVLLTTLLRSNAAIAFMAVCVGSVLVTYTSSDVTSVASGFSTHSVLATSDWVKLALLVIPLVVTVLFTRKAVKGLAQLIFNGLPALATGLLLALLVIPLLPSSVQRPIESQSVWHQLLNLQTAIVLGGALLSLLFLLSSHRTLRKSETKHSKGH